MQFAEPEGQEEIESPTHSCLNWPLREFLIFFCAFSILWHSGDMLEHGAKIIIMDRLLEKSEKSANVEKSEILRQFQICRS